MFQRNNISDFTDTDYLREYLGSGSNSSVVPGQHELKGESLLILLDRVGSHGQSGGDRNLEAWQLFEEGGKV